MICLTRAHISHPKLYIDQNSMVKQGKTRLNSTRKSVFMNIVEITSVPRSNSMHRKEKKNVVHGESSACWFHSSGAFFLLRLICIHIHISEYTYIYICIYIYPRFFSKRWSSPPVINHRKVASKPEKKWRLHQQKLTSRLHQGPRFGCVQMVIWWDLLRL